jgi:alkyl hydroperoxide reductase subunit F
MLDDNTKAQVRAYLERLARPIELTASLDGSKSAQDMRGLLDDLAGLSDKVAVRFDGQDARKPSFSIGTPGAAHRIRFAGLPMGHEFTSLILALLQSGGYPPKVEADLIERVKQLSAPLDFEIYVSLECHNCPDVVQALNLMAALNPQVSCTMIEGSLYRAEVEAKNIMAVPMVFLNGEHFGQGRMALDEILAKVGAGDTAQITQRAAQLDAKAPFDVLVVGGGPAGAAAAIYAARKGIRTGVVAERFGGQVLDTLAIENFISVSHTEGPRLAAALEQHVKEYGVDIMNMQRVESLVPGEQLHEVRMAGGGALKAKTVVLATGARWREMNVPGENQYRGKGVAYCPHCDGPLFKGKRVAVIGGGNSGIEAAIDLAGIVGHVTVLEFADTLRADAVLQEKLASLPNVRVIKSALTTEVLGDGHKVTGLVYTDRTTNQSQRVELEGIFVQIGLLPNTDFLKGTVNLSKYGEIEVDAKCQTSAAGVFAAGDCTTVPYKQIVIAMGEGAKASLSAFDHLIRHRFHRTER